MHFLRAGESSGASPISDTFKNTVIELKGFQILPSKIHDRGLFSERRYAAGDFIFSVDIYYHSPQPINFINHSCDPNSSITGKNVLALKIISISTEITIDYDQIPFDARPWDFECGCGAADCKKRIVGGVSKIT